MLKIREHYDSLVPKLFKASAITFRNHIFYTFSKLGCPTRIRKHEMAHINQYRTYGTARFLLSYMLEYCWNRLKGLSKDDSYKQISYEIEARQAERN